MAEIGDKKQNRLSTINWQVLIFYCQSVLRYPYEVLRGCNKQWLCHVPVQRCCCSRLVNWYPLNEDFTRWPMRPLANHVDFSLNPPKSPLMGNTSRSCIIGGSHETGLSVFGKNPALPLRSYLFLTGPFMTFHDTPVKVPCSWLGPDPA